MEAANVNPYMNTDERVVYSTETAGITYNYNYNAPTLPRKRSRDSINYFSFLGEDITHHIHQQHHHLHRLIAHHMEKVRMELEEKRKSMIERIQVGMMKRVRAKEEEIEKMSKLKWGLEERVKCLCIEKQIWRDLAHTNEATANALRSNLEQLLLAQQEDAESCCGDIDKRRLCSKCGKEESCVLILPCRHLCVCSVCGSTIHTCPLCKSFKNATLHVNISS